jgi:RNA polymerase sigma-54 factor
MLKQQQSQKMLQKLSPQQIQLMKLLQVPTAMLEQRIQEELEGNPALEVDDHLNAEDAEEQEKEDNLDDDFVFGDEVKEQKEEQKDDYEVDDYSVDDNNEEEYKDENTLDDYLEDYLDDDVASYKLNANNYSADQEEKTIPIAVEGSFLDYLEQQLGLKELEKEEELIALQIIGSIDEDGYLRREPAAIADDLMFAENIRVNEDRVLKVLEEVVHTFDPPGVGARDLQECLYLQLDRKLHSLDVKTHYSDEEFTSLQLAHRIIKDYFEEFSKKHYKKLLRQLSLFKDDLKAASDEILKLNPKPGSAYAPSSKLRKYIVPDFIIENKNGELVLSLNSRNAPELRINNQYKNMLEAYSANRKNKQQREAAMFVKQKIDAAKWFIDAIKQRQETMFKTMYTIMTYQEDFFLTGDQKKLKPMILKDIAEITGLDISTVSRVANSKYVQTEFGTKLLKDFFSESLQTDSGEEVSTLEVKKILTEIIDAENKRKPLSDEKLKNKLQDRGYNIARRTVAKYREQLNIPVARLRKEL